MPYLPAFSSQHRSSASWRLILRRKRGTPYQTTVRGTTGSQTISYNQIPNAKRVNACTPIQTRLALTTSHGNIFLCVRVTHLYRVQALNKRIIHKTTNYKLPTIEPHKAARAVNTILIISKVFFISFSFKR